MRLPGSDSLRPTHAVCERDAEILAAYRPGAEPTAAEAARLQAHLVECESCRRTARVSAALSVLAAEDPGVELPDPHHVLWRARVLERFAARDEAAERAAWPLQWAVVGAAFAVVVLVGLMGVGLLEGVVAGGWWVLGSGGLTSEAVGAVQGAMWVGVGVMVGALGWAVRAVFQEG